MSTPLRLRLLGGHAELQRGDKPAVVLGRKAAALLTYLALAGPTPRTKLTSLLWPTSHDKAARNSLRQLLHRLKELGELLTDDDLPTLAPRVHCDALELTLLTGPNAAESAAAFDANFWNAPLTLLGDLDFDDCPELAGWLQQQRERLRRIQQQLVQATAEYHEAVGDYRAALRGAELLRQLEPLSEEAHRRVIRLHYLLDDHAAAAAAYRRLEQLLERELGLSPSRETARLAQMLQRRNSGKSLPAEGLPAELTPFVGRRSELLEARRQLADADCRLLTVTGPGGIGKTRLALRLAWSLRAAFLDGVRFVPVGELTSTAQLVAALSAAIGLEPSSAPEPGGTPGHTSGRTSGRNSARTDLLEHLRSRQLLLVLDGFEQLLRSRDLLADILRQAGEVKLLVTSRQRLGVHGEWQLPLAGLPVAAEATTATTDPGSDAAALFARAAARVRPDFALDETNAADVNAICRLVEGVPLGIELAAAWVRAMPCHAIARELSRGFDLLVPPTEPDGQSAATADGTAGLQVAFERSWAQLNEREQLLLGGLAVFRGGFDDAAAEAVAQASLRDLAGFLDRSLLYRSDDERFAIHSLIRYCIEAQLAAAPARHQELRARHATYFLEQLSKLRRELRGPAEQQALNWIDRELANVRQAWQWALEQHAWSRLRQATPPLALFCERRGRQQEGSELLAAAIASLATPAGSRRSTRSTARNADAPPPDDPHPEHDPEHDPERRRSLGQLLVHASWLEHQLGNDDRAEELAGRGIAILEQLPQDQPDARHQNAAVAQGFFARGAIAWRRGDHAAARAHWEQALSLAERGDDPQRALDARCNLAMVADALGDRPQAKDHYLQAHELAQQLEDRASRVTILNNLGYLLAAEGRHDDALVLLQKGLQLARAIGHQQLVPYLLDSLALTQQQLGRPAEAVALAREALELARARHDHQLEVDALLTLAGALAVTDPSAGERRYQQALALAWRRGYCPAAARAILELAELHHRRAATGVSQGAAPTNPTTGADAIALLRALTRDETTAPSWRERAHALLERWPPPAPPTKPAPSLAELVLGLEAALDTVPEGDAGAA